MYTPVKVKVGSTEKLKEAIRQQRSASVRLNLDGAGEHTLLLTRGQIAKIERAKLIGKHKLSIRFSKKQVQANVQYQGGFLGMLAGLAAKALPLILGGLTTGLVSGAVEKAVGSGLYLHKSGHCVKVEPVKGNGLYLTPHRRWPGVGDGLYLKRGSNVQPVGSGLILGKNSPFKNIPILGALL